MALKIESGIQLLARLSKKQCFLNFYPELFPIELKAGDIVEICTYDSPNYLLLDIMCEALIPKCYGGIEASVILINTDGNININTLLVSIQKKIETQSKSDKNCKTDTSIEKAVDIAINNLNMYEVYDEFQFQITLLALENVLIENSSTSIIVFDTLTSFYWCEQSFKVEKMDTFLKKLLQQIQRIINKFKLVAIYTKPNYFSSKQQNTNLPLDEVNYRINLRPYEESNVLAEVCFSDRQFSKTYKIDDGFGTLIWIQNK